MDDQHLVNVLNNSRDLLFSSLDKYDGSRFLEKCLEKGLIDYHQVLRHYNEISFTGEKIDYLLRLFSEHNRTELAREFMEWLKNPENNKIEVHQMLIGCLSNPDATDSTGGDVSHDDDDGIESDCESLSRNTTMSLDFVVKKPTEEFVKSKMTDSANVYSMSSPSRGTAVLVINEMFTKSSRKRSGSGYDTRHLSNLFTALGYNVKIESNKSKEEFLHVISRETRDLHDEKRTEGSFVLCVLSHGQYDAVVMSDNQILYLQEIYNLLDNNNFPSMAGKPKFLYFDLDIESKGNHKIDFETHDKGLLVPTRTTDKKMETNPQLSIVVHQSTSESLPPSTAHFKAPPGDQTIVFNTSKVPCKSDFVICLAAFPYYTALHNNNIGSIATRVITEVFSKHAHHMHILDLLFKVRRKLCTKTLNKEKQVVTTLDTLLKDFYLFPVD